MTEDAAGTPAAGDGGQVGEPAGVEVRDLEPRDHTEWVALWSVYLAHYGQELPADTTALTWRRLTGAGGPGHPQMGGLAAVDGAGRILGLAHYVVSPNTWSEQDDAYLEDLAVVPEARGRGVGAALIEALAERGRAAGWRRLHWITDESNVPARRLYDRVATRAATVRYEVPLTAPPA